MKNTITNWIAANEGKRFDIEIMMSIEKTILPIITMDVARLYMDNAKFYIDGDDLVINSMVGEVVASSLCIPIDCVMRWTDDDKEFGYYYIESMVESIF